MTEHHGLAAPTVPQSTTPPAPLAPPAGGPLDSPPSTPLVPPVHLPPVEQPGTDVPPAPHSPDPAPTATSLFVAPSHPAAPLAGPADLAPFAPPAAPLAAPTAPAEPAVAQPLPAPVSAEPPAPSASQIGPLDIAFAAPAAADLAAPPAAAPATPEPSHSDLPPAAPAPSPAAPPSSDWVSPATAQRRSRRRVPTKAVKQVGIAVGLGALGFGGLLVSQQLAGDESEPAVPPPAVTTPIGADAGDETDETDETGAVAQLPVSPDAAVDPTSDVGIIADVDDIVADINDNDEEAAALELLDLDPAGPFAASPDAVIFDGDEIADGTASVSDAQSYSFSWSYPAGTSITAWVDASTGDFQMTTAANHVLRSVDGLLYEQAVPGGQWSLSPLQEFADRSFIGRDRLITMPAMLPAEMLAYATLSEIGEDGFGSYLIDDVAFHRENPELRADWLTIWGFDATRVPTESADVDGEMPDAPGPGQILVHTEGGLDAVVTTATVSTPDGTSTYVLLEASRDERALAVPDLG